MRIQPYKSTFIVTGGASGLGEACVRHLFAAPHYANVVIVDFNEERGNALEAELNSMHKISREESEARNRALFFKVNITDEKQVQHMVDGTVKAFGIITGLINCAGIGNPATVVSEKGPHSLNTFQTVINVNLVGTFNVLRIVAQHMAFQKPLDAPSSGEKDKSAQGDEERGVIICTASVAAFEGQIGQASYSASKGAIVSMTLPIARELSRYGIRVITIAPGLFMTPMMQLLPEKLQKGLAAQVPFPKRMGHPSEFAHLCQTVIENPMLNGTTIRLDGSLRMSM